MANGQDSWSTGYDRAYTFILETCHSVPSNSIPYWGRGTWAWPRELRQSWCWWLEEGPMRGQVTHQAPTMGTLCWGQPDWYPGLEGMSWYLHELKGSSGIGSHRPQRQSYFSFHERTLLAKMKSYKTHTRSEVGCGIPRTEDTSQTNSPQRSLSRAISVPETPLLSGEPVNYLEFVGICGEKVCSFYQILKGVHDPYKMLLKPLFLWI